MFTGVGSGIAGLLGSIAAVPKRRTWTMQQVRRTSYATSQSCPLTLRDRLLSTNKSCTLIVYGYGTLGVTIALIS
ncbi:hypothetical protein BV22DRAFT_279107 [Leucogyrophana mollusca]|uniref:Uncharacterized protein n=1 Tax=Leucogyrophana mollusca TaxID=85980 RepID=A0ACB8BQE1_9AGAM|nr:hypothetical protein BV22DRAFT_279107 [Leucogyrophana mollusca]